ncbi:MAG: rRNA maturation RNase YbeY [Bdellovibrionia bacterium]
MACADSKPGFYSPLLLSLDLLDSVRIESTMTLKELVDPRTIGEWQELANSRLVRILKAGRKFPALNRMGPKTAAGRPWAGEVQLVGRTVMSRLNYTYRKKKYPTDVLSFPAPLPFVQQGMLGELIICLPVLKAQAKEIKNSPQCELDVLLVHGVLHLLGFDHEKGPKEASAMARWETRLLDLVQKKTKKFQRGFGLIERSNSDKESP